MQRDWQQHPNRKRAFAQMFFGRPEDPARGLRFPRGGLRRSGLAAGPGDQRPAQAGRTDAGGTPVFMAGSG